MVKLWNTLTSENVGKRIKQAVGWLALVAPIAQSIDFKKPESKQVIVIVVQGKI